MVKNWTISDDYIHLISTIHTILIDKWILSHGNISNVYQLQDIMQGWCGWDKDNYNGK